MPNIKKQRQKQYAWCWKEIRLWITNKISSNCFLFYVLYKLFKSMVLRKRSESWQKKRSKEHMGWSVQKQPPEVFYKKAVLKNSAIFTGKHLRWSLFLMKLQAFSPATLLKRDSSTGFFSCEFCETFKNINILKNICERLLLAV